MKKNDKSKSWRSQSDFPNLEKKFTLNRRQEFLDSDYVKGVVNKDGELAIRALTRVEKEWLNQFYQETLNSSLHPHNSFYPIPGASELSPQELKELRKLFLTEDKDKIVDEDKLGNKKLVKKTARKYKIPQETVINLLRRKQIYDANNKLNNDWFKLGMRATCEYPFADSEEDYFQPHHKTDSYYENHFEDTINEYLDYEREWKQRRVESAYLDEKQKLLDNAKRRKLSQIEKDSLKFHYTIKKGILKII